MDNNRSIYKFGEFPIVHLKRNEIKRNLVKSSLVRIAAPNKTIFNRDLRAAIIRSNSFQLGSSGVPKLAPTKMKAKDDSHKIITNHEPVGDEAHYPQSAKSVLDALEKNCRKRINNEELTLDRNKKQCTISQEESLQQGSSREFIPITPQSVKRNREQVSPNSKNVQQSFSDSQLQQSKKLRTRTNALLSSLSSSHFSLRPYNFVPSLASAKIIPTPSIQIVDNDEPIKMQTEVSPEPIIIPSSTTRSDDKISVAPPKTEEVDAQDKRLHLFNRKISESRKFIDKISNNGDDDDGERKIHFVKPREKPQNEDKDIIRHVEQGKLTKMLSGLTDGLKSPFKEATNDTVDSTNDKIEKTPQIALSFNTITTNSAVAPISTPSSNAVAQTPSKSVLANAGSIPSLKLPEAEQKSVATTSASSSTGQFQFGNVGVIKPSIAQLPELSATHSASVANQVTTPPKPISGLALFSTPGVSTPASNVTPVIDPSKSLITFTPIGTKSEEIKTCGPSLVTSASALSVKVPSAQSTSNSVCGFSFSTANGPSTSASIISTTSSTQPETSFSFGSSNPPKLANAIGFGNLNSLLPIPSVAATPSNPILSATSGIAVAPAPSFNFGTTGNSSNSAVSESSCHFTKTVSFMTQPETTKASGIGFSFQNTSSSMPAAPSVAPTVTTANSGFSFSSMTTPSVGMSSSKPEFGQPVSTLSTAFGQKIETQSTPSAFTFGQKTEAPPTPSAFPFTQKPVDAPPLQSPFSFGQNNQPTVSQPTTTTSGFSFSVIAQSKPSSGIFARLGEQNKPAMPMKFENVQSSGNIFGTSSAPVGTQVPMSSVFGSTVNTPTPAIGGNMFVNQSTTQNNVFGSSIQSSTPSSGNLFAFGSSTSSSLSKPIQQPQNPSTQMFNFSSNAPATNSSAMISNSSSPAIFGGNSGGQNVSASFTFKAPSASTGTVAQSQSAANIFSQSQPNLSSSGAPPAYQFGNVAPSSNTVSASFTFGGPSANTPQTAPPSTGGFNFNAGSNQTTPGIFNFQNAQPALPAPSSPGGGLFNIGTGGNKRPVRQATRRIK